jgi:hypothetical protein
LLRQLKEKERRREKKKELGSECGQQEIWFGFFFFLFLFLFSSLSQKHSTSSFQPQKPTKENSKRKAMAAVASALGRFTMKIVNGVANISEKLSKQAYSAAENRPQGITSEGAKFLGFTFDTAATRFRNAGPEAAALWQKVRGGNLSFDEVRTGACAALIIFSCFKAGEVVGRGNLIGYDISQKVPLYKPAEVHH